MKYLAIVILALAGCTQAEPLVCDRDQAFEKVGTVTDECAVMPVAAVIEQLEDDDPTPLPEPPTKPEPPTPDTPTGKTPNPNKGLNSGRGNGDECNSGNCDPGKSGGKNQGGDEV